MRTTNKLVAMVGTAGLVAGLASATEATTDAESTARRGVCSGVKQCYVMGHVDVTGDGKRDWVGAVNRNGHRIRRGKVTVRVLAKGRISKVRLPVRRWRGDVFHGIARIDGRRGAEMVVGARRTRHELRTAGGTRVTYSKAFHVLTVRHGDIVRSKAPGKKARTWTLTPRDGVRFGDATAPDAARSKTIGYHRQSKRGKVRMVRKQFECAGLAGCGSNRVTFVWRHGGWAKRSSVRGQAHVEGAWHVKGLPAW